MAMEHESELELVERVERMLGADVTQVLRDAADALERVAPVQFEAIGTRALDLDALMITASAAAALPELMARFRLVSTTRRSLGGPSAARDGAGRDRSGRDGADERQEGFGGVRTESRREFGQDRLNDRVA